MFLAIWYFLFGSAKIKVTGFGTERLLNILSYKGVYVFDVAWKGVGVSLRLPKKDLPILEDAIQRVGCHLESVEYGGLPALLHRFRGREVLGVGCLVFACMLYVLSSFVWVVSVEGNERISQEDILEYCKELGLSPANWKRNISTEEITKALLVEFPDISWVSVGIKGTNATIKLTETIEKVELIDKDIPTDVVATKDGVVVQITAERGTPMVAIGDVVKTGDILISSEIQLGLEGEDGWVEYVHAEGSIQARTWQYHTEELDLTYIEQRETDLQKDNYLLYFGDAEVDLLQPKMEGTFAIQEVYTKWISLGDFSLPIGIAKESYHSYTLEEKTWSIDEAKKKIDEKITKKAENILQTRGTIEMMDILYTELDDSVKGEAIVVTIEEIGAGKTATVMKGWDAGANGTNGENIANGE
ncbi:sporulation protein YqfD [Chakrabartyella piscis]|uniref:sporulation protein YqfD n=1 Tax=Chakrabartyella piscis TaxID=2918914 RepID=UPI002958D84E|nr:sporulation protein YqfD [Chakrabartyella piscis]